jgi:hypothetical protein
MESKMRECVSDVSNVIALSLLPLSDRQSAMMCSATSASKRKLTAAVLLPLTLSHIGSDRRFNHETI